MKQSQCAMISVKCLTQNQSKSNNINHAIHLNYFRKKCYECWAPTKAQMILHELIPQIPLFWNMKIAFMFIKNKNKNENYLKMAFKKKKFCKSKFLKIYLRMI